MRRSTLEKLLSDLLDGTLAPEARAEAEALLESDPAARALFGEMQAARAALATLRERPPPPVSAQRILPAIQAAIAAEVFERRPRLHLEAPGTRYYRRVALAAILLCALSLGLWWSPWRDQPAAPRFTPDRSPTADERPLRRIFERGAMSAEDYLRLLDELGGDPSELRDTPFDDVIPISLAAPIPR